MQRKLYTPHSEKPKKEGIYKHSGIVINWKRAGGGWVSEETMSDLLNRFINHLPKEVIACLAVAAHGDLETFVTEAANLVYGPKNFQVVEE